VPRRLQIATITQFGIFLAAVPYGVGRHNFYIDPDDQINASRLLFFSQLPWGWSVAFGKISIALLLLRLKTGVGWRIFLYAMMAVQLASAVHANTMQLVSCRPISAAWRPEPQAKCLSVQIIHDSIYVQGSVAVLTDFIFALIPLTFISNIRRGMLERLVIVFLMGLGLFTAAGVIVKLTLVHTYGQTGDMLWDSVDLNTWSILEGQMGIVAACMPCLKSPFHAVLRRMGLLKDTPGNWESYTSVSIALESRPSNGHQGV
jgi:hypothetical protein